MAKLSYKQADAVKTIAAKRQAATISKDFDLDGTLFTVNYKVNCGVDTTQEVLGFLAEHQEHVDQFGEAFIAFAVLKFGTDIELSEDLNEATSFMADLSDAGVLQAIFEAIPGTFMDQLNTQMLSIQETVANMPEPKQPKQPEETVETVIGMPDNVKPMTKKVVTKK